MKLIILIGRNHQALEIKKIREAAAGDNSIEVFGDGHPDHSIKWLLEKDENLKTALQVENILLLMHAHGENVKVENEDRVLHASGGYRTTSHLMNAIPSNIQNIVEFSCYIGTNDRPFYKRNSGDRSDPIPNEDEYMKAVYKRVISSSGDSKYPTIIYENNDRILKIIEAHKQNPQWSQNQLIIYDALLNPLSQYICNNIDDSRPLELNIAKLPRFLKQEAQESKEPNLSDLTYEFLQQKFVELLKIFPEEEDFITRIIADEKFIQKFNKNFLEKAPHLYAEIDAPEVLEKLVNLYPQMLETQNYYTRSPLLRACEALRPENVKILISAGSNPNYQYSNNTNPLTNAAAKILHDPQEKEKNTFIVEELLKSPQIEINDVDGNKNYPFDLAFEFGNKEIAKLLVQDSRFDFKQAIDRAINYKDFKAVKFIFDYGILPRIKNEEKESKGESIISADLTEKLLDENPIKFQEKCYEILANLSEKYQFEYINFLTKNCTAKDMVKDFAKKLDNLKKLPNFPSENFIKNMEEKIQIPQKTNFDTNPNSKKAELLEKFKTDLKNSHENEPSTSTKVVTIHPGTLEADKNRNR